MFETTTSVVPPAGAPPKTKELSARDRAFVAEYLIDLNAERAAIAAGYSRSVANKTAYAWVSGKNDCGGKQHVYDAIQRAIGWRASNMRVTAEMIVQEYARLAFSNMRDFAAFGPDGVTLKDIAEMPEDATRCIAEVSETKSAEGGSIKFKLHDKKGALDSLARHLGMFVDKTEVTGKDGGPIEVKLRHDTVERLWGLMSGKLIDAMPANKLPAE